MKWDFLNNGAKCKLVNGNNVTNLSGITDVKIIVNTEPATIHIDLRGGKATLTINGDKKKGDKLV